MAMGAGVLEVDIPEVVSDTKPLMHLPAIGRLELLRDLYGEIHVPHEVDTGL